MPRCFIISSASAGKQREERLKDLGDPCFGNTSGNYDHDLPPRDPSRLAQRPSLVLGELKRIEPVTTSNEPSPQGRSSKSPTRRSASGVRSAAISTVAPAASIPATFAPRAAAS
jgi:hypothetical protein